MPSPKRMLAKMTWLMPGLSFKRWVLMAAAGFSLCLMGLALVFNMQPVAFLINTLKKWALILPNTYTGPAVLLLGVGMLYWGAKQTQSSVYNAFDQQGSLLDALYRRHKLAQGPHVVAIGGGTGLSTLLRGLKHYTSNITAVVTVGDDGGSSGRLRKEQGIIPPGDIRNCIAALADDEGLMTELFQYRFKTGPGLEGHSFGNLFLTALCRISGDMMSAIQQSSKILNIGGRVLPSTLDHVTLCAEMDTGEIVRGESAIPEAAGKIVRMYSEPEHAMPLDEVLRAIATAELILLGPGSLYTSVIPNLLIPDLAKAVALSKAPKLYVANIMGQPGETEAMTVSDHIKAIIENAAFQEDWDQQPFVDAVMVNATLPPQLAKRYEAAHVKAVPLDESACHALGVQVIQKRLVDDYNATVIRHHSKRLAAAIMAWFKRHRRQQLGVFRFQPFKPVINGSLPIQARGLEPVAGSDTDVAIGVPDLPTPPESLLKALLPCVMRVSPKVTPLQPTPASRVRPWEKPAASAQPVLGISQALMS